MGNIKKLASDYLSKMNGNGYSLEEIDNAMSAIRGALQKDRSWSDSVFTLNQDMNAEAFTQMMRSATKANDGRLDADFAILFDIINSLIKADMAGFLNIGNNNLLKKNCPIKIFLSKSDKSGYFFFINMDIILLIDLIGYGNK